MATRLTKPVSRVISTIEGDFTITLANNGVNMRKKSARSSSFITYEDLLTAMDSVGLKNTAGTQQPAVEISNQPSPANKKTKSAVKANKQKITIPTEQEDEEQDEQLQSEPVEKGQFETGHQDSFLLDTSGFDLSWSN